MNYDLLVKFVQQHFTDGLALVLGSGLSSAEGIPGMPALTDHLRTGAKVLDGADAEQWCQIESLLASGHGLEAALLAHQPSGSLEAWITRSTCELLLPKEREAISSVVRGDRTLRLTTLLGRILKPRNGLPILTTNYDRLVEVACEMAGFHVDTTAVGIYAGEFDHNRSCMASCRAISTRGRTTVLDHYPRAIVLKPHGSFDWYKSGNDARRSSLELDAERLIITPGLNKYRAGYNSPFDKHRELANDYVKQCSHLLISGYGFNDDHLQTHLIKKILDGTPTLILNYGASDKVKNISRSAPRCVCLSRPTYFPGVAVTTNGHDFEKDGHDLWDLGVLAKELLT